MRLRAEIRGIDTTLAALNRLPASLAGATRAGLSAQAEVVANAAKGNAPVATGQLRDSIKAQGNHVVVEAPYASFVELGTRNRAATPYLTPALYGTGFSQLTAFARAFVLEFDRVASLR